MRNVRAVPPGQLFSGSTPLQWWVAVDIEVADLNRVNVCYVHTSKRRGAFRQVRGSVRADVQTVANSTAEDLNGCARVKSRASGWGTRLEGWWPEPTILADVTIDARMI
jgi:hypothetical protein